MGLNEQATEFLTGRGVDIELAVRMDWNSAANDDGTDWIAIPFVKAGQTVNRMYRCIDQQGVSNDPGGEICFWNYDVITDPTLKDEPLYVFQTPLDALLAIQCGFVRSISAPEGYQATQSANPVGQDEPQKYEFVSNAEADLKSIEPIVLATHTSAAGVALFNDLAIHLDKSRVQSVSFPRGCMSLSQIYVSHGIEEVGTVLRGAKFCFIGGIGKMAELPPVPPKQVYSTGKDWLDPHYKIRMGDFCVVTGRPSDGKSTFVNDILCSTAETHGWRICFASFEQPPQTEHKRVLREWFLEMPEHLAAEHEIDRADEWIDRHFVFIVPHWEDYSTLDWVIDRCKAAVIRYGAKVIVIDPWNEMDHSRPRDMSLTEYVGGAIRRLKRLAESMNVHVIVVAHPAKYIGTEAPSLYSISDSAHWANKSEVGIVVYKPNPEKPFADIIVKKVRYHDQIGKPGIVNVEYVPLIRRFQKASFTVADDLGEKQVDNSNA